MYATCILLSIPVNHTEQIKKLTNQTTQELANLLRDVIPILYTFNCRTDLPVAYIQALPLRLLKTRDQKDTETFTVYILLESRRSS